MRESDVGSATSPRPTSNTLSPPFHLLMLCCVILSASISSIHLPLAPCGSLLGDLQAHKSCSKDGYLYFEDLAVASSIEGDCNVSRPQENLLSRWSNLHSFLCLRLGVTLSHQDCIPLYPTIGLRILVVSFFIKYIPPRSACLARPVAGSGPKAGPFGTVEAQISRTEELAIFYSLPCSRVGLYLSLG